MDMVEHIVEVNGPKASADHRSPESVGHMLKLIEPLVRGAVSMAFRYTSTARGRPPDWLASAWTVNFEAMSEGRDGCTRLHFGCPRFGDAAAAEYEQQLMFETRPREEDTGFDLIGDLLEDVAAKRRDSHRFDRGLLKRLGQFGAAKRRWGVDSLGFLGDRLPHDDPTLLNDHIASFAAALESETPKPKRTRIMGKLDMIRDSDGAFAMLLDSGEQVHGVWLPKDTDQLAAFWRKPVVVEGRAVFCASGSLLRIEAEGMAQATDADAFFAKRPEPDTSDSRPLAARVLRRQTATTGAAAIFGQWPGDETEEELLVALKEQG